MGTHHKQRHTQRAPWPFVVVEWFQVQRADPQADGGWSDVPQARRADESEAFDLADELRREFPGESVRVVRRWGGR